MRKIGTWNWADALEQAMARQIDIEALTGDDMSRDVRTIIAGALRPWINSWSARLAAADVLLELPGINGEDRAGYILALRAQALDQVQDLIKPDDGAPWPDEIPLPTPEVWQRIIKAAFPPPPIAGGPTDDTP